MEGWDGQIRNVGMRLQAWLKQALENPILKMNERKEVEEDKNKRG